VLRTREAALGQGGPPGQLRKNWAALSTHRALVLLWAIIVVLVVAASINTSTFMTSANITNVLRQSVLIGLVAIGQVFVVFTGGIDFSIGVNAKVSAIVAALVFGATDGNIPAGVAAGLGASLGIGLVNATLITRIYGNPFIITFGMFSILQGVALAITHEPVSSVPSSFLQIYDAKIGIIPWCIIAIGCIWALVWLIATRSGFGRALYAVGGSPRVARLSGINVPRTLVGAYMMSGLFGGLAGLFSLSQSGVADIQNNGLEFASIVAIAVGGVSLLGGAGSIIGAFGGVLLLGIVSNLLNLKQVSEFYQEFVTGVIILLAVATFRQSQNR
jgi:ribose/xylose/arabinose/galactoside ABC-type transport system permease subunit